MTQEKLNDDIAIQFHLKELYKYRKIVILSELSSFINDLNVFKDKIEKGKFHGNPFHSSRVASIIEGYGVLMELNFINDMKEK